MVTFSPPQDVRFDAKLFLEGAAGTGKTTYAIQYLLSLLDQGIAPDRVLVMVPQVTLGRPYQLAIHESPIIGGMVQVQTIAGIARRAIETYWPVIAQGMGFADPSKEPTFLNIEAAQYYMARIASNAIDAGQFASLAVAPPRIISQVLDNLTKAALLRFPIDEVAARLKSAWGEERDSTRPPVYDMAALLATQFREHCLANNLLDYSLLVETFQHFIEKQPKFASQFARRFDFLLADNIEEINPAGQDFIRWLLPRLRGGLILYDTDAGYRIFLGADPDAAYDLAKLCDRRVQFSESKVNTPELGALGESFSRRLGPVFEPKEATDNAPDPLKAFTFQYHRFYPQMVAWTADQIADLVNNKGVSPREIVVLAPYLNDSLRFSLTYELSKRGIAAFSHRPSRSLRDEPATRTLLTLAALAHPDWEVRPPAIDVADALTNSIDGLDPVRSRLLTSIVYRPNSGELSTFTQINDDIRTRLTYVVGERYERLRQWLVEYRDEQFNEGAVPLDHFFSRLFGEVLSQPGYGFHVNLDAGRVTAQLIESAQQFRRTLYGDEENTDWLAVGREYITLIERRLIASLFVQNWQEEAAEAVFLAPAFTYLMRNRAVDYQFWLDVGNGSWSERLEQPLTHPYVLKRDYPREVVWTDEMEEEAERDLLYKVVMGLTRRCRQQIYLGITDLGESGFEARGLLLRVFQGILTADEETPDQSVIDSWLLGEDE